MLSVHRYHVPVWCCPEPSVERGVQRGGGGPGRGQLRGGSRHRHQGRRPPGGQQHSGHVLHATAHGTTAHRLSQVQHGPSRARIR